MKSWDKPIIKELDINKTALGSNYVTIADYTFRDQYGHVFSSSSGTGLETDERKDVIDPENP